MLALDAIMPNASAMPICTRPKTTVAVRPTFSVLSSAASRFCNGRNISLTNAAAEEFSELDSVDIAAAKTAASVRPRSPTGM